MALPQQSTIVAATATKVNLCNGSVVRDNESLRSLAPFLQRLLDDVQGGGDEIPLGNFTVEEFVLLEHEKSKHMKCTPENAWNLIPVADFLEALDVIEKCETSLLCEPVSLELLKVAVEFQHQLPNLFKMYTKHFAADMPKCMEDLHAVGEDPTIVNLRNGSVIRDNKSLAFLQSVPRWGNVINIMDFTKAEFVLLEHAKSKHVKCTPENAWNLIPLADFLKATDVIYKCERSLLCEAIRLELLNMVVQHQHQLPNLFKMYTKHFAADMPNCMEELDAVGEYLSQDAWDVVWPHVRNALPDSVKELALEVPKAGTLFRTKEYHLVKALIEEKKKRVKIATDLEHAMAKICTTCRKTCPCTDP